ncbi:Hypothetical predicted protein [Mytilus galloprovincialis]|uniref:Uncharacterized protein n=1 Tax=Mytilus galloprovincialis TaxID=29158 RepID=A0A8B6EYR2_MYTGA|nr:Hypothetical predicted protein [Mytilus galloprovincialis]
MALVNEDKPIDLNKTVIPPLFASSSKSVINVFVQHNCNINVLDSHGQNALYCASERGSFEMAEFLNNIGCKMNVIFASGNRRFSSTSAVGADEKMLCYFFLFKEKDLT